MRIFRALSSVVVLGLATGCANLAGTFTVDRFLNKEITGDTIGACMARSYQSWARNKAWVQVDYAGAAELAVRGQAAQTAISLTAYFYVDPNGPPVDTTPIVTRLVGYWDIAQKDPSKACACGNAIVAYDRWSNAKAVDERAALQKRLDDQAAACEGPTGAK